MLAIVAHPDDLEYGASSAIARWTKQGKQIAYVIATSGEAGIDAVTPHESVLLRQSEQRRSAAIVGVADVEFLNYPDGTVEYGPPLRRDLARSIRRFKPDVILTATYALTYGPDILNQADHRHVGLAALDATRDAANRWIFPELLDEALEPWSGVTHVYVMGAQEPQYGVDVTDTLADGVASLRAHQTYIDGLGRAFDPDGFLSAVTAEAGYALGVEHAVALGRVQIAGV